MRKEGLKSCPFFAFSNRNKQVSYIHFFFNLDPDNMH